jgi:hypothetical protein
VSLDSYSGLVSAVGDWFDRDDLTARVPDFIRLTEVRLNRILEDPDMEVAIDTVAAGAYTALPADFGSMVSVTTGQGALAAMGAADFAGIDSSVSGIPRYYTIVEGSITFAPANATASIHMVYRRSIPPLTADDDTNWLLERAPDVYLYGALVQASAFLSEDDRLPLWKGAFDEAINELRTDGAKRKWGAGPLAPRIRRT